MRIRKVQISNLRAIADATVEFDDYTCLVGANGAGKSTVLFALNVLFRETDAQGNPLAVLAEEDFHRRDTSRPASVTVWFDQLSAEAQEDFKDYYRNGFLVVTAAATFDEAKGKAEIKQFGQRMAMAEFAEYFGRKGDGAKVAELKDLYTGLRAKFPDLNAATTGPAMEDALRTFEAARPDLCTLIPSEDQFYGATKGQGRLQRHIQWVYVPAVKDASTEQAEGKATALGKLLARTVRAKVNFAEGLSELTLAARRSYQQLLDESQEQLSEVSSALNARLAQWAHPEASLRLQWHQDSEKSIRVEDPFARVLLGEGEFQGELGRFGHGFQRSYLLALLQELANADTGSGAPKLILGCEEPELYQHPPQARHLAGVLQELANTGSQVMVSTHSPLFVGGDSFESVRLVRRDAASHATSVCHPTLATIGDEIAHALGEQPVAELATLSKIYQLLQPQLAEMFFTQRLALVEGIEDCAYIHAWLALKNRLLEFRRRGTHLVPVGGKSELLRPAVIARHMGIPLYLIFDADGDKIANEAHRRNHERDNKSLFRFLGVDDANLFPDETLWSGTHAIWPKELSDCVDADLRQSLGDEVFEAVKNKAAVRCGQASGARKHTMMVGAKLAYAVDAGASSPTLDRLCDQLIAF